MLFENSSQLDAVSNWHEEKFCYRGPISMICTMRSSE